MTTHITGHLRSGRPRLLVIGAGDVAFRALPWLAGRFRVFALCRSAEAAVRWRAGGAIPLFADLDQPATLKRLAPLAEYVLHTAPPDPGRSGDPRSLRLLAALGAARIIPRSLVYISTTGVYGDCQGARIAETRPRRAQSERARRRVEAEQLQRIWLRRQCRGQLRRQPAGLPGSAHGTGFRCSGATLAGQRRTAWPATALSVLRAPGIYAGDRLPLDRLRKGTPALRAEDDGYTSHIHAADLARAACLALFRLRGGRAVQVCDDSELKMGAWFEAVAAAFDLAAPRRISREEAERTLPESLLSFMRESRRLDNTRMKRELRLRLGYPTVAEGLTAAREDERVLPVGADGRRRGGQ